MAKLTEYLVRRIHALRKEGLDQQRIALRVSVSHDTVRKVLQGKRKATIGDDGRMLNHKNGWTTGSLRQRMAETGTFKKSSEVA